MSVTPLNTRGKKILQAIVEAYIETAQAVSSQAISLRLRSQISAATVRNVMTELDGLGFIWQPHTSAGRIPTDRGYRYYIDSLLELDELRQQEKEIEEKEIVESRRLGRAEAFDEFLTEILRILSNFTGYTAMAFSSSGKDKLYFERTSYLLEQPEFQAPQKMQAILRTFERQQPLLAIMKEDLDPDGVKIHIGCENPCRDIQECSLVISNFKAKNRNMGALGIIGPRRMAYAKVICRVGYMARIFSERITDLG